MLERHSQLRKVWGTPEHTGDILKDLYKTIDLKLLYIPINAKPFSHRRTTPEETPKQER